MIEPIKLYYISYYISFKGFFKCEVLKSGEKNTFLTFKRRFVS